MDWLQQRLQVMRLVHGPTETDENRATAWLIEYARLLRDIPKDILDWAIDEALRKCRGGWLPSVGEIRAIADEPFDARRKRVASMRPSLPPPRLEPAPVDRISEEEAAQIIDELCPHVRKAGAGRTFKRYDGPPRNPTRQDYADMGYDVPDTPPA